MFFKRNFSPINSPKSRILSAKSFLSTMTSMLSPPNSTKNISSFELTQKPKNFNDANPVAPLLAAIKIKKKTSETKNLITRVINDKHFDNLRYDISFLLKNLIKIFLKPRILRTEDEKLFIRGVLKKNEFFKKLKKYFGKAIFEKVLPELKMIFISKLKVLDHFEKGFFLLEGEIYLLNDKKESDKEKEQKDVNDEEFEQFLKNKFPEKKIKRKVKAGEGFNFDEMVELRERKNKGKIFISKESSNMLFISKNTLIRLIDEEKSNILNEKLSFLSRFPVLSKLSKDSLRNLLQSVDIKFFKFGSLVHKEGQILENIYFIKNGEIEISRLINKDYEDLIPVAKNIEEVIEQTEIIQKKKLAVVNRVWSAQNSKKCNKRFTISILGPNQFFGNNDQEGNDIEARATVKSEMAEIYMISKFKINEICHEYGIENEFGEIAKVKDDWHHKLEEKIHVFLDFANKIAPAIPKINKIAPNDFTEILNKNGEDVDLNNITHLKDFDLGDSFQKTMPIRSPFSNPGKRCFTERAEEAYNNPKNLKEFNLRKFKIFSNASQKNDMKVSKNLIRNSRKRIADRNLAYNFIKYTKPDTSEFERKEKIMIKKRLNIDKMFPNNNLFLC